MIGLGCLKLLYNHWRLRKYTTIAATRTTLPQDMQQTTPPRRRGDPGVPFGVRALESGIEVDGVWHSRSNTPAPSIPDSPMSSASASPGSIRRPSSPDRTSTSSNISKLEMPQPVHGYPGVGHVRSVSASGVVNAPFERGIAPERSSSRPNSISPEYLNRDIPRGHQTYQPRRSSHLRFSNSQSDNSAAMAALEGHHLISKRESSDGKLQYFVRSKTVAVTNSCRTESYEQAKNRNSTPLRESRFTEGA